MAQTASTDVHIPRPATWESPDFNDRANFQLRAPSRRDTAPDTILQSLSRAGRKDVNKIANFLRKILNFGGTESWEPHHLLGEGGFGRVGVWVRTDERNKVEDEVVVKDIDEAAVTDFMCFEQPDSNTFEPDLLAEAVIQKLVNDQYSGNVVHLRGYKYVTTADFPRTESDRDTIRTRLTTAPEQRATHQVWYRLYFEYAPYGNLHSLIQRYRLWHQYFPEPFLWHVFDCLCQALVAMFAKPPTTKILGRRRRWANDAQIVHFDIKPNNIFMGYEGNLEQYGFLTGGAEHITYPMIKLGDFGVGEITHPGDTKNPSDMWHQGTPEYRAPEQLLYGVGFQNPPNGQFRPRFDENGTRHNPQEDELDDVDPGYKFLEKYNVWGIGKVMYDLATLSRSDTYRMNWAVSERDYQQNGRDVLSDYQTAPFRFSTLEPNAQNPYSRELMEMIQKCLKPSIADRIGAQALVDEVQNNLHKFDTTDAGTNAANKLFFKDNEINDMPRGTAPFVSYAGSYDQVLQNTAQDDPNWPDLVPPPDRYQPRVARLRARWRRRRNRFTVRNGRVQFQGMVVPGPRGGPVNIDYSSSSDDDDGPPYPPSSADATRGSGRRPPDQPAADEGQWRMEAARALQRIADDLDNMPRNDAADLARVPVLHGLPPVQQPYNHRGLARRYFVGIDYGRGYGRGRGGMRRNGRRYTP